MRKGSESSDDVGHTGRYITYKSDEEIKDHELYNVLPSPGSNIPRKPDMIQDPHPSPGGSPIVPKQNTILTSHHNFDEQYEDEDNFSSRNRVQDFT